MKAKQVASMFQKSRVEGSKAVDSAKIWNPCGCVKADKIRMPNTLRRYKRVSILLPRKKGKNKVIPTIIAQLCKTFGGDTHRDKIVLSPAHGDGPDRRNGKMVHDRHISVDIDIDSSNDRELEAYFYNFKRTCQDMLDESELWITFQDINRVV